MHPDHLLDDLTFDQLSEWIAYDQLEPFGEQRSDLRMARIVWAIVQVASKRAVDEKDFLFKFGPKQRPTWQDMRRRAEAMTAQSRALNKSRGE